jgi:hypothetical protein
MTPAVRSSAGHTSSSDEKGEVFDSQLIWAVIALLVLLTAATVIAIGAIYYGDDVHVPAWNEHSVPPAKTS